MTRILSLSLLALALSLPLFGSDDPPAASDAPVLEHSEGEGVTPGLKRYQEPDYPRLAMRHRIEGQVKVELQFDSEGRVTRAKVLSGHRAFHRAVLQAVRGWEADTKAPSGDLGYRYTTTFEFRLDPEHG